MWPCWMIRNEPFTSDPAPGSVAQYAPTNGSSIKRPRYLRFCASLPASISGIC